VMLSLGVFEVRHCSLHQEFRWSVMPVEFLRNAQQVKRRSIGGQEVSD